MAAPRGRGIPTLAGPSWYRWKPALLTLLLLVSSLPAVLAQTTCGQSVTFNYATAATGSRKSFTETVGSTTLTTGGYTSTVAGTNTNLFSVGADAVLGTGNYLVWKQNDIGVNGANVSTVTYTFSRPLTNFRIRVTDIDQDVQPTSATPADFIDRITFDGYDAATAGNLVTLTTADVTVGTNGANRFVGSGSGLTAATTPQLKANAVTGIATSNADRGSDVTVRFPSPIQRLVLTYENIAPANTTADRTQTTGIVDLAWCAQADIQTTVTGPTSAAVGSSVSYTVTTQNLSSDAAANGVVPTLTLAPALPLASLTLPTGANYNSTSGVVTFATINNLATGAANAVTNVVRFVMPNSSVSGTARNTASPDDPTLANNNGTSTSAQITTTVAVNQAPVASNVTNSPNLPNSSPATAISPLVATDANGNGSIVSYTLVTIPDPTTQGVLYVNGGPARAGQVLTPAQIAQLSFAPVGTFVGNATFTYLATDDQNATSNTATYTIPVVAGSADVVTTISGPTSASAGQTVSYQAISLNNGPNYAQGVAATIQLTAGTTGVTVTNGSYNPATGLVTFDAVGLASGASVVNTVSFVAPTPSGASTTVTGKAISTATTADGTAANNNGTATAANVTTTVNAASSASNPAPCSSTFSTATTPTAAIGNQYYAVSNQATTAGTTNQIILPRFNLGYGGSTAAINNGDLLLIVQMQGAEIDGSNTTSYGSGLAGAPVNGNLNNTNFTAGRYEYAIASGYNAPKNNSDGSVTLSAALRNAYSNADATTSLGQSRFQVIKVASYQSLALSGNMSLQTSTGGQVWNGRIGGVIALDVLGTLNFAGFSIDASGAGFRGGGGRELAGDNTASSTDYRNVATKNVHGAKGEGTAGTPRYLNNGGTAAADNIDEGYLNGSQGRGGPGNAGGGGTDANAAANDQNTGGGGGANGGQGGRGGNSWFSNQPVGGEPGAAFPVASTSRLVMGGGGGAGTTNNGTGDNNNGFASSGAAGGGMVFVRAGSIAGAGFIKANGASANNSVLNDGSGGGGAGGSIVLTSNNTAGLPNIVLQANGGNGGSNTPGTATDPHGPGGGGGGGFIFTNGTVSSASSANGGSNGVTRSSTSSIAFGAEPGQAGVINTRISNVITNTTAAINCAVDLVSDLTGPTTAAIGSTVNLNVDFYNNGGVDANSNVPRTVTLVATGGALSGITTTSSTATVSAAVVSGSGATATYTYTITYPATSLTAGTTTSFGVTYVVGASTSRVVANSNVTTNGTQTDAVSGNNADQLTTNISANADVTTTLSGPTTLYAGQPSGTYTATFTNNGPASASGVTQKVTLPTGVTSVLVNGASYTPTGGVIDFGNGTTTSLASGATNTFTFSFTAPTTPTATGSTLALTSNVTTSTSQGGITANDAASLALTVLGTADVRATISAQAATVTAGNTGQFNVTFSNIGTAAADNTTLQVQLAPNLANVTMGAITGFTASYNSNTGLVTYTPTTAPYSAATNFTSGTVAITFTAPTTGPVTATAAIGTTTNEGGLTANNTNTASINVTPKFDLQTRISGPTSVPANGVVTYNVLTFNASNGATTTSTQTVGSISPATSVVQTVQLPANLTNVYVSNGGTYDKNSGLVTFPTLPSLAPGASLNNVISYSPTAAAAAFTVTATATPNTAAAGELNIANNTASVTTTVTTATTPSANLYTQITTPNANVASGSTVTFTVNSGNNGPSSVTDLTQTVSLPLGLSGVTVSGGPAGFTASNANYDATTGLVTLPTITGPVTPATAYTYTITVQAPTSGYIVATSAIGSAVSDPMPGNNVSSVDVTVNLTSNDIATAITGPQTAVAGQAVTYTVTTTNNGTVPANPTQTVYIPAGLTAAQVTFTGPNATTASYDATTGLVTFGQVLNLAPGALLENTVTYLAPNVATLTNVASVAGYRADNVPANNTATATTTILPNNDFTVAINGPATTVAAGNLVTYTVTTTNNGPSSSNGQTTTVQLPTGLTGLTAVSVSGGGTYNNTTGVVTFPAQTNQAPGAANAIVNTITFTSQYVPEITAAATVTPTTASNDQVLSNNYAVATTVLGVQTATVADIQTTVAANVAVQTAGSPVIFTVTTTNATLNTAASQVAQKVLLRAGLTGVTITGPNGAATANYDATTGVVTLPVVNMAAAASATTYTYTITVNAPGADPLTATAVVTDNTSDPNLSNNVASATVSVASKVDEQIALVGPTQAQPGSLVTYIVTASNNGPSTATDVSYTVQLPTGLTDVVVSGDGAYNAATGVVTFGTLSTQATGTAGQVSNTITFTAPTYTYTATANVVADGDAVLTNNTSAVTTQVNYLPLALAVVNGLQAPEGNTAGQLTLSPVRGTDTDPGTVTQYVITSLPTAAPNGVVPGVLYYNGAVATVGTVVTDASKLTFDPAANFVGNAFFTYAAVDNQGGQSLPALYTIPVGQDNNSVYTTVVRGGNANTYQNNDVVAYGIDTNGAAYSATGVIYDPTTSRTGALASGTVNGIQSASITAANTASLAAVGIVFNSTTGLFTVSDRTKLPRVGTTVPVTVTTIDLFGGTNTQVVNIVLGVNPLPVELTDFTATAVKNVDAALVWHTASEKSNDYFDVERSLDGTAFEKIGQVKGQGNSTMPTAYALTDAGIGPKAQGLVYYRLKQVDADGTATYSPVRTVNFTKSAEAPAISLWPNPATASTQLDLHLLPAGTYQVRMLDATGRVVLATVLEAGLSHALDLNTVASGTYLVQVMSQSAGQSLKLTTRFVKE